MHDFFHWLATTIANWALWKGFDLIWGGHWGNRWVGTGSSALVSALMWWKTRAPEWRAGFKVFSLGCGVLFVVITLLGIFHPAPLLTPDPDPSPTPTVPQISGNNASGGSGSNIIQNQGNGNITTINPPPSTASSRQRLPSRGSTAIKVDADGGTIEGTTIKGNTSVGFDKGIDLSANKGGKISDSDIEGNVNLPLGAKSSPPVSTQK
jgi:hypothetical protein